MRAQATSTSAAQSEVSSQRCQLTAKLGQVDFQAGKEKQRCNTQGRKIRDNAVGCEGLEKTGHDDSESKAGERSRQTEALQCARNHQQAKDHGQIDKGRAWSLHCHSR